MSKFSGWANPEGALQRKLLNYVDNRCHEGATVHECYSLFETTNVDHPMFASHGWISGALSILHRDLRIVRLADKRNGAKVYVTPDFIDSRKCEVQGRGGLNKDEVAYFRRLEEHLEYWLQVDTEGARFATRQTKARRNMPRFIEEIQAIWATRPEV